MAWRRLSLLLTVALASGLIAAGCGGDEDGDGDNVISVPTEVTVPTEVPENVEEAKKQATEAVEGARSQAYETCVDASEQLPEPQKSQALEACEDIK